MEQLDNLYEEQEDSGFRDQLSTLDEKGNRKWLFPKKPVGRFFNARKVVSYILLIVLVGSPFVKIKGEPLLLFNIFERKFVIFGQVFWPQDSYLFAFGLITLVVFIILFTVIYGRIFCGWVCPQTIFMEMVFRRLEYLILGDYTAQRKLKKAAWTTEKIWKMGLLHFLFLAISFIIMHTFIAYLVGVEKVQEIVTSSPTENLGGFIAAMSLTGIFYWIFAFFREQVCTNVCPYGRLQGVLLDRHSVIVAYDHHRGESRGKFRKGEDRVEADKGDCIDCKQCVYVCPTGIDIRNGTQLECVNCTACIDACDSIMDRVGMDRGLIRYASEEQIETRQPFKFTTRMMAYSGVLVVLLMVFGGLMTARTDVDSTVLRTPGVMFQKLEDGRLSNLYNYKVINKTNRDMDVEIKLLEDSGEIKLVGEPSLNLESQNMIEGALFIYMKKENLEGVKTTLDVGIYGNGELLETIKTSFVGPAY